jgi:ubiquinone/menaquinone biosynthesis C-methylase UbiE
MSVRDAYNTWSASYDSDRNLTRDLDAIVTRDLLSQRRYRAILELGCGTGKNTALLVRLGERVQALDFSAGMIAQAQAKIAAEHLSFALADLTERWPCADRSVDLIVCNLVLEHIADLDWIFAEAARVLLPDGQFFLCELHPFKQYQGAQARFQRDQQQVLIPAFVHHISDFLKAAASHGLRLQRLDEWWHAEDQNTPPRLVSFIFAHAAA